LNCSKCGKEMILEEDVQYKIELWHCTYCGNIKYTERQAKPLRNDIYIFENIIRKMCDLVGLSILDVDFSDKEFKNKTFWSEVQKQEFKRWLLKYLEKNKKAQVYLFKKRLSKKDLVTKVDKFIDKIGWLSEEEYLKLKEKIK